MEGLEQLVRALGGLARALDENTEELKRLNVEFKKLGANAPDEDPRKTPGQRLAEAAAEAGANELARALRRALRGK